MNATVDRRLRALEQDLNQPRSLRVLHAIINPDKTLHSFYADGRTFERQGSEPDDAF